MTTIDPVIIWHTMRNCASGRVKRYGNIMSQDHFNISGKWRAIDSSAEPATSGITTKTQKGKTAIKISLRNPKNATHPRKSARKITIISGNAKSIAKKLKSYKAMNEASPLQKALITRKAAAFARANARHKKIQAK